MKIYISGKITGTTDYMERFERAEHELTTRGFEVVNPAKENARLPEGTPWKIYMAESLRLLLYCDAIYLMDGWNDSRGAKIEFDTAIKCGLQILAEPIDKDLKLCYNESKQEECIAAYLAGYKNGKKRREHEDKRKEAKA